MEKLNHPREIDITDGSEKTCFYCERHLPEMSAFNKKNLIGAFPGREYEINIMTDTQVAHALAQNFFEQALEVYGQHARGTITAYWKLQRAAYHAGERATLPEHRSWTEESEQAYRMEYLVRP